MKTLIFVCLLVSIASCTYQYGSVRTKPGESDKDRDIDLLTCARAADMHGGASAAGWIPFAGFSVEKHIRREEFKNCMEAKGYVVIPPE